MNTALNLAKLIAVCGEVAGRKKMQKIVHLLQEAGFEEDFPYSFGYLHYGPYSHGVKYDLDLLRSEDLVIEETVYSGEHESFRYMPVADLDVGLRSAGISAKPAWSGLARELNAMSPSRLEAASTVAFLHSRGFTGESLRTRFRELKPFLDHDFEGAMKVFLSTKGCSSSTPHR
jgi:hypothetical protein